MCSQVTSAEGQKGKLSLSMETRQVLVDDIKSITKNKSADLQRQVDILTSTEHLSHMLDEGSSKTGGKM